MLSTIEVRSFRNLEPATLELPAGGTLILGENGAGKTSLLEAVYTLSTCRSFRANKLADCVRRGESDWPGFKLVGETDARQQLTFVFDGEARQRFLNGERAAIGRYLGALPVIAWTASDLDVLVGPPLARRRFLDRGVVAHRPASIDIIARYRRALAEKRKLLQDGCRPDDLVPWNLVLAGAAATIVSRRSAYCEALVQSLEYVVEICQLDLPPIELGYRPSPPEALDGEEELITRLEAEAEREIAAQMPLYGPHRDDLRIRFGGAAVRDVASAGERKAIGLMLTAAHARTLEEEKIEPVYLLDDVDTELDEKRLVGLWRFFGRARQILATSNRPFVFRQLPFERRLEAAHGRFEFAAMEGS